FFSFFALALLAREVWLRWAAGRPVLTTLFAVGLGVTVWGGVYDQTPRNFPQGYPAWRLDFAEDEEFARRMEASVPPGSMIYQLPYMPFPEVGPVNGITNYDLFRPYLHTRTLRWSYGAMKG